MARPSVRVWVLVKKMDTELRNVIRERYRGNRGEYVGVRNSWVL